MYSFEGSLKMHSSSQEKTALIYLLVSLKHSGARLTNFAAVQRTLEFEITGSEYETSKFQSIFNAL